MSRDNVPQSDPFFSTPSNHGSYGIINRNIRKTVLIDDFIGDQQQQTGGPAPHGRFKVIGLVIALFTATLIGRSFLLQVVSGSEFKDQAENNRIRREIIPAMRGLIVDKKNAPLVKNIPNFTLTVTPYLIPANSDDRDNSIARLADLSGIPFDSIYQILANAGWQNQQPVIIAEHLSADQTIRISTAIIRIPGVEIQSAPSREYHYGVNDAHLIGYIGRITKEDQEKNPNRYSSTDYIGKVGLELTYDDQLRGLKGFRDVERDHLNREKRIIASAVPKPGSNLRTTIDQQVQDALATRLQEILTSTKSPSGAAVAIDPRNGGVLAMVSFPSYDPNKLIQGLTQQEYTDLIEDNSNPFLNRAVSGEYPSGSTIKPFVASAALQEHIVTPDTSIMSTGGIAIDKWFFPDWKSGGHGATNLIKALAESVNTYFYTVGGGNGEIEGLGVDRLNRYMKLFGLSEALGIDIPNERAGFLPTKEWKQRAKGEGWYIGDTYHYSIGQGDVLVTPLQMACATAVIANQGTLFKPHLASAWLDYDFSEIEVIPATIIRKDFIDKDNLNSVRIGMREAVISGSARSLNSFSVPVAAKTGTAQVSGQDRTTAWFTAFAPYDAPEITISVVVENGGEGYAAALPVAQAGLSAYFK